MEVGSWVGRDLYSGRIVRIPNNTVLKNSVFNYSQGFRFIWDQIKVVLTITSDAAAARTMLLRVAHEVIGEYLVEAQNSWNAVSDDYRSENPPIEPVVALAVNAGSLEFTLNYVVDYAKRTTMQDRLFAKIVEEIASSKGQLTWASSGVTVVNQMPPPDPTAARPATVPPGAFHASESR
jgi:small-conductance mechanosensitive channel